MLCTVRTREVPGISSTKYLDTGHKFDAVRIRCLLRLDEHGPMALSIYGHQGMATIFATQNSGLRCIAGLRQATRRTYSMYRPEIIGSNSTTIILNRVKVIWDDVKLMANLSCCEVFSEATERGIFVKFLSISC